LSLDLKALETSFDLIDLRGDELMDEFFSRLFATEPSVKPLFRADLESQKTMLLAVLALVRKSFRNLDDIAPTLRKLGACNVAHGARPEHYRLVSATLIASMAAIASKNWKPEYERAWNGACEIVTATMLEGAAETTREAA
jgi:hemoglobin-like flavoprotein